MEFLPVEEPLAYPFHLFLVLFLVLLSGLPIRRLLDAIGERVVIPRPRRIPAEMWDELIEVPRYVGGRWIGLLERFIFFSSILAGAPELVFAWLAFKVASKWEVWNNVYRVPDTLPGSTQFEFFFARTRWGARTFQRFLVGTAANLSAAIIGVALFQVLVLSEYGY